MNTEKPTLQSQIDHIQRRQREIEKSISAARDHEHQKLHEEYQANQKRLGRLLLERDKQGR